MDPVLRDLVNKATEDAYKSIQRTMALADTSHDKTTVFSGVCMLLFSSLLLNLYPLVEDKSITLETFVNEALEAVKQDILLLGSTFPFDEIEELAAVEGAMEELQAVDAWPPPYPKT